MGTAGVGAGAAAYEADRRQEPPSSTLGQTGTTGSTTGRHHHGERDVALGTAGVGAGTAAYEVDKHHGHHGQSTSTVDPSNPTEQLTGPVHKSSLLNKLDPRVKTAPKSNYDEIASTPGGTETPENYSSSTGHGHHLGRDAAGGVAAGGAAYEAEKHHHHKKEDNLADTTGQSDPYDASTVSSDTGKHHHLGRDTAGGAALGGAAYEAEKHHHHRKDDKATDTTSRTDPYDTSAVDSGTGKHHHHLGRDAAGGTALAGAGYEAEKHHNKDSALTGTTAGTGTEHGHLGHGGSGQTHTGGLMGVGDSGFDKEVIDPTHTSTAPPSAYTQALGTEGTRGQHVLGSPENIRGLNDPEAPSTGHHHHRREEEALGAGAVGGAALSDKEAHKLEKQHDKELRKEEKQHEKELRKEEKYEEKHHDGKKSGGILGLFKRDKTDKDSKEEEAAQQSTSTTNTYVPEAGVAAAAGSVGAAEYETGRHERNRLHKVSYLDLHTYLFVLTSIARTHLRVCSESVLLVLALVLALAQHTPNHQPKATQLK